LDSWSPAAIGRNVRLLLQGLIDAGIYPDDIPVDAMKQVVTGMITHAGISLAEANIAWLALGGESPT
jgi:hypothetical protein